MSTLRKKLFRDITRSKGQFTAVIVMVLLGIAFFNGVLGSYRNLQLSINRPYEEMRFADLTVDLGPVQTNVTSLVSSIPGISQAIGRINVELPAMTNNATDTFVGRVVTLPAPARPSVNDVLVTAGSYLTESNGTQVLVERAFANHHKLGIGDRVHFITPKGGQSFTIVGIVLSPEYLWPARTVSDHMPDVLRRWGVFFAPYASISSSLGMTGMINEVAVTLQKGTTLETAGPEIRSILSPYGITDLVPREKQASNLVTNMSVDALNTLSIVFPTFFLTIVALSTYVLLTRLVYVQRQQIGVLMALGVNRRSVLQHYLGFALLIGLGGSIAGSLAGYLLAGPITDLFAEKVSLPLVYKTVHWDIVLWGIILAVAFSAVAAVVPALRASRVNPAETMRGESPRHISRRPGLGLGPDGQNTTVPLRSEARVAATAKIVLLAQSAAIGFLSLWLFQEYRYNTFLQAYLNQYVQANGLAILTIFTSSLVLIVGGYGWRRHYGRRVKAFPQPLDQRSKLPTSIKLPFRSLTRNPTRTAFTILALALAGSLVVVPLGFIDSMNYIVNASSRTSAFDIQAMFHRPQNENITAKIASWTNVTAVEPILLVQTTLQERTRTFDINLFGLTSNSELYRLYTANDHRVYPQEGMILLSTVFQRNGIQVGDTVRVGLMSFKVEDFVVGVSNIGYAELHDAQTATSDAGMVNGVLLTTNRGEEDPIQSKLYSTLPVWSVTSPEKSLQDTNDMLRLYYGFIDVIVVSGLIIALAIVFNFIMINVLERGREIATMRTIGMGGRRIATMLTLENLTVLLGGIALGSIIGLFLTGYFVSLFQTDLFVLTPHVNMGTYVVSGLLLLGVLLVSQLPALRSVQRMDLAKASKERVS